jgi:haloalkane dehalogenase
MNYLRTPDEHFQNLPDFSFQPHYLSVPDGDGRELRIHYVDEGPQDAEPILMMHGEPSWAYLYRKMIPIFVDAGYRAVAPDLVGFGRSDKLADREAYTYQKQVDWMQSWLEQTGLERVTLICQDWGGLIGLRLVANQPNRFARVVAANTGLPIGDTRITDAFLKWRKFSMEVPDFDAGVIVAMGCKKPVAPEVIAAYNAPFPEDSYKAAARIFPSLVPLDAEDPAARANREAWEVLSRFDRPFITMFSDGDPITRGGEQIFQKKVAGAQDQPHLTIQGGGHFLQEDCGEEFARKVVRWMTDKLP